MEHLIHSIFLFLFKLIVFGSFFIFLHFHRYFINNLVYFVLLLIILFICPNWNDLTDSHFMDFSVSSLVLHWLNSTKPVLNLFNVSVSLLFLTSSTCFTSCFIFSLNVQKPRHFLLVFLTKWHCFHFSLELWNSAHTNPVSLLSRHFKLNLVQIVQFVFIYFFSKYVK